MTAPSKLDRLLRPFSEVRAGEAARVLTMLASLLLLMIAYYVLKTVREPLILATGGAEVKTYAAGFQALLLIGFVPAYGWLTRRVNRRGLIIGLVGFFGANLEIFYLLVRFEARFVGVAFFVWVGIFSLSVIAQFWSLANDLYSKEEGERLFPIIAFGATVGSPIGAGVAEWLFEHGFAPATMLQIAAGLLVAHGALMLSVTRAEAPRSADAHADGCPPEVANRPLEGGHGGFELIARSPYLRLVALLLVLLNIVNTVGEYLLSKNAVAAAEAAVRAGDAASKGAFLGSFYGSFFLWVNLLAALLQALVVSRLVKKLGLRGVLLFLPVLALGIYGALAAGAGFAVVRWLKTFENASDYSVMNSGKAMLWLPTTREEKYRAKQAIDTAFVRFGDVLATLVVIAATSLLHLPPAALAAVNTVLCIIWIAVAWSVARRHKALAGEKDILAKRAASALGRVVGVRPDHRWNAGISFLILFGVMASYAMLETARDALFLSHLPASKLPWAYLMLAGAVSVAAWLAPAARRHALGRKRLSALLLMVAATLLAAHGLVASTPFTLYAFYVGVGVAATMMLVRVWLTIGGLFDIAQARRLFALIASGGILGALGGSALAARITQTESALSLVPFAAAILALTAAAPLLLRVHGLAPVVEEEPVPGTRETLGRMVHTGYARQLFWMVVLGTIATTMGDFLFKSAVATGTAKPELGTFFARYQLGINALALVMQLLVAPLLLRRMGANRAILGLPALSVVSALGFVFFPGIAAGLVVKGVDGALRNSLQRTATEVLYVPLPRDMRARLKTFIDGVGQRGGQALASLLVLGALAVGAHPVHLAIAVALIAGAWLLAAAGVRRHYVDVFRGQIRAGKIDGRAALPPLDLQSVESLLLALNSSDDSNVIAALDTLSEAGKAPLIPALILYHPSADVAAHALDLLAATSRTDYLPLLDKLLVHPNAALRAAALRARAPSLAADSELRRLSDDPSDETRATALVALLARETSVVAADWPRLEALVSTGSRAGRLALLAAVTRLPRPDFVPLVAALAADVDSAVQLAAARAMQATPDLRYLQVAREMLASRETREAARAVFLTFGRVGEDYLAAALRDHEVQLEVRRHIPRTLSRFGSDSAAAILLGGLANHREPDGVIRYKMLRGLGRMRKDHPELRLDKRLLTLLARRSIMRSTLLRRWLLALEQLPQENRAPTHGLLQELVVRKQQMALERAFRFFDLLHPEEDFERIYDGLLSSDGARRANSRELLEFLVEPSLRAPLLALLDETPHPLRAGDIEEALTAMSDDHSVMLRSLAADSLALLEPAVRSRVGRAGGVRHVAA